MSTRRERQQRARARRARLAPRPGLKQSQGVYGSLERDTATGKAAVVFRSGGQVVNRLAVPADLDHLVPLEVSDEFGPTLVGPYLDLARESAEPDQAYLDAQAEQ